MFVNCKNKPNCNFENLIIGQNKSTQNMQSKINLAKISLRKINLLKPAQYTVSYRYSAFWISSQHDQPYIICLKYAFLNY